jgi:hypothetical protein
MLKKGMLLNTDINYHAYSVGYKATKLKAAPAKAHQKPHKHSEFLTEQVSQASYIKSLCN